ncbi:MAG: helix-hairpin-helix domain-containing protein [Patescibacteria group bacterium]|nr:helix-hairpin-helix domain-containing protein [Patescibacteria group bacterium]
MTNSEIAKTLRDIAAVYSIKDEKKHYFQIAAYQRAADTLERLTIEASDLFVQGRLREIKGVGQTIAGYIEEMVKTGKVKHFEELKKTVPPAVFPLLNIPKIGPKTAFKLVSVLKLKRAENVVEELEKKAKKGEIAAIEGFGEKSQSDILRAIEEYYRGKTKTRRMVFPFALEIAERVVSYLKKCPEAKQVEILGSLRRKAETVGDIDIAVASDQPQKVLAWFGKYPEKERVIEVGDATSSILTSGQRQVDVMVQPSGAFGSLLQHFTGSKAHNIHLRTYAQSKGLSLSEYGIKSSKQITVNRKQLIANKKLLYQFSKETDFYEAIGLQWIAPEMREDTGEIELAIKHKLPDLVELKDIKGDLHTHSSFNIEPSHDLGANTIGEMAKKAENLGYKYLGLAEHNPSITAHNNNQIYDLLCRRNMVIEKINTSNTNITLFKLLEVDIQADGNLALDDKILELLDGAIVSIHSSFRLEKDEMTKRILKGLSHPKARILGHPTGRLLNERPGIEADWPDIFEFCQKNNKALEINSWPYRLDLPDTMVREAVKMGVKMVIDTDSHASDQMDVMRYGVYTARRGWATKENILNTLPPDMFRKWLENK